jgi:hypothetical protein
VASSIAHRKNFDRLGRSMMTVPFSHSLEDLRVQKGSLARNRNRQQGYIRDGISVTGNSNP